MNLTQLRRYKISSRLGEVSFSWNGDHPSLWWICLKINRRWEHIDLRWLLDVQQQKDFLYNTAKEDRLQRIDKAKEILERYPLDTIKKYLADAEQIAEPDQNSGREN